MKDLLDLPGAREQTAHTAVADRQQEEPDHRGAVEKTHAPLQAEEGLFPVVAFGKQAVELRVDGLEIGGAKLLADDVLAVIADRDRGVKRLGQVLRIQYGRRPMLQTDLRLVPPAEDLVRGIRTQSAALRADRDILLLASFRQSPRGEGAEERVSGAEDLKEMRQQIFF